MKAIYYFNQGESRELNAKEKKKGFFDLSDDSGEIVVSDCPVSEAAKDGHCVIESGDKKK